MTTFVFALTNPEAQELLKFEVKERYPDARMSFLKPGFITYKWDSAFSPNMARLSGVCLGKKDVSELLELKKAWLWKREEHYEACESLIELTMNSDFELNERVSLIMMINPDEYWLGEYILTAEQFATPGEVSPIEAIDTPSRAYYKIAEVFKLFPFQARHHSCVLELGSAPGGASHFLLSEGFKVLGVDPAHMDESILSHSHFTHIKKPFEVLGEKDFQHSISMIVSDINLPPHIILREVERLLTFLSPHVMIITLKINSSDFLNRVISIKRKFEARNYQARLKYLPSYKKELCLIAWKDIENSQRT